MTHEGCFIMLSAFEFLRRRRRVVKDNLLSNNNSGALSLLNSTTHNTIPNFALAFQAFTMRTRFINHYA